MSSYRCMVRRSVIVEANSEVILPVTIKKRMTEPTPLTSDHGLGVWGPAVALLYKTKDYSSQGHWLM